MVVEAGQIGRHGANSAGIALNANGLGGRFGDEIGVPQTFIRRRILDQANFKDALQVPFSARQQIPTNLLYTHRDGVSIDLETTPGGTSGSTPSRACWCTATTTRPPYHRSWPTATVPSRWTRSTGSR